MEIHLKLADKSYLEELVEMNLQLVADEQFDRPRPRDLLIRRWQKFFDLQLRVLLFRTGSTTVGYALVDEEKCPVYLMHFFIKKEFRRKGIGRRAFDLLMDKLAVTELDLDVMVWNERGRVFWKSLGFAERTIGMTIRKENIVEDETPSVQW